MPTYANALIDLVALVVVVTILMADRKLGEIEKTLHKIFKTLLGLIVSILIFDITAWLLDGQIFPGAKEILYLLNTAYYAGQIIYSYFWYVFAEYWNHKEKENSDKKRVLLSIPMIVELVLIVVNPSTGWIFQMNDLNVYVRGPLYTFNLIPYYFYIIGSIVITIFGYKHAKTQSRKQQSMQLIVFMLLPICGVLITSIFYGTPFIWPFTAISLLMVYINIQQQELIERQLKEARHAKDEADLRAELMDRRMAIMVSQIQPHFMFNALATMQALCKENPDLAQKAMGEFSEFLRGNMDSLTSEKPIIFRRELEHTRHYLAVEKLRFQDNLNIAYDIQVTDFYIPTLTLQPIVENAVRYGITKRVGGGTVTISTRETVDKYVITVADDGIGFNTEQVFNDNRSHVGIANVRDRLQRMCNGTLDIDSKPGISTTATITIPRD